MRFLVALLFLASISPAAAAPRECVNVFYDRSPQPGYWMGRTYAQLMQNLLGHFPELQQIVSPIELYQKGDLDRCRASIYIGSHYETKIPPEFLEDYSKAKKNVAWLGYNIWQVKESELDRLFGFRYDSLTTLDSENLDAEGFPTFYKFIEYKSEIFYKYGDWNRSQPKQFLAPFEQARLVESNPGRSETLASARHSKTGDKIPYIIRAKNRFYVADVPFSFLHEADRYLVFADVLFDILDLPPRHNGKHALVRLEDVHALTPLPYAYDIIQVLREEKVPIHISLIPIFFDPLKSYDRNKDQEFVTMNRVPEFMSLLKELRKDNPTYIWHGVTHQNGRRKNPHDGESGSDFEFWDAVKNAPLAEDSVAWVLNRLEDGLQVWRDSGLADPIFWLTPHYQASTLDYTIFGRVFPWNVGRVIYFNHRTKGILPEPEDLLITSSAKSSRQKYFEQLEISIQEDSPWSGQIFPYEIYGDVHGQRLIPENLGNSQPFEGNHVLKSRTVQQMLTDAKRNLVLRDSWASFFYHPFLLKPYEDGGRGVFPGDATELRVLLKGIKSLGYTFLDLKDFAKKNTTVRRPEPIYRD